MNIRNNNLESNNKIFELEENSNDYLKDLSNYIPNLLNYLWENPELVALLLNNSNIEDIKDHLASFIVNNFYENILLSNSIENNLMYVITLMLKEEINNIKNINEPELFLNKESPCNYLLSELVKKDNIRQYFKKVLLNIIENLEEYSSNKTFNLNLKKLQKIVEKNNEKNINESINENDIVIQKLYQSLKIDEFNNLRYYDNNNVRINNSYTGINRIDENVDNTKIKLDNEMDNLEIFTKKYVNNMAINDLKKMIMDKYNDNQNMKDYCTNQLINCGQNIINRDYYSNKSFMENLYCSQFSREILILYKKDFLTIIEFIELIFNNIKNNIHSLPYSIKCLCKIISKLIINKYNDINIPQQMGFLAQFFFNILLIPILQNPGYYLLIDNMIISKNTIINTNIIANIIGQLVSGKFYKNTENNSGYTPFNWYFLEKLPDIFDLFEELSKVNLPPFLDKLINNELEEDYQFNYFRENRDEEIFYRAICYNIYDINALLNSMNNCKEELFFNSHDLIFRKTFEKLNSESNQKLIEKLMSNDENDISQKQKSIKTKLKDCDNEQNKPKQKFQYFLITDLLTDNKYIELFNIKIENYSKNNYSIKELKIFNSLKDKINNNIIRVKNFLICLLFYSRNFISTEFDHEKQKNTIDILNYLKEFNNNSNFNINDSIPLEWYINSLLEYLKIIPDEYIKNDFEKLYEEIENEINLSLKKIDFQIVTTFFEKVKLAQREKNYFNEIIRITTDFFLNEKVQTIVEEEFIPFKIFFNYNNEKKEFYFTKSKMKEKDYAKKKAEKKLKKNFCKSIKSFTKKFPDLTIYGEKDIFAMQTELNMPEKLDQYFNMIKEYLLLNKKVSTSIDIEIIINKIRDYVMSKIYKKIFPICIDTKDEEIEQKCKLLVWTKPKHFIQDQKYFIFDCFMKDAIYYFNKIEEDTSPMKKMQSIKEIFNFIYKLVKFNGDNNNKTGIDDLMPILNYALIKAKPERMHSNLKFIDLYIGDLRSKEEGSQLIQLIALCDFICNIEANNLLGISKDEFHFKCDIIGVKYELKK